MSMRVQDLSRSFGRTKALDGCSLDLTPGEVHAVAGENGSGKSTLVKVMSGVLLPDSGTLAFDGEESPGFSSPAEARAAGVATVFQEILMVETLNALENVWLGADGEWRRKVPEQAKREQADRVVRRLLGHSIDLAGDVSSLDLSVRQTLAIARALVQEPRVLILDESTSALDVELRDRLLELIAELRDGGTTVVFISHRMDEIEAIADRVTVLRSGRDTGTLRKDEVQGERIVKLMSPTRGGPLVQRESKPGARALTMRDVALRPGGSPTTVTLRAGEILGLAGLEGHGQERFLRVLAGLDRPDGGQVVRHLPDGDSPLASLRDAVGKGVAYVPRDRKAEGVFESLSIADNFAISTLGEDVGFGLISGRRRRRRLDEYRDRLGIRYDHQTDAIGTLSGGNQQKIPDGAVARCRSARPGSQRSDPGRRPGDEARPLPPAGRDGRPGRRDRDAVDRGGGAPGAHGPRPRVPGRSGFL